MTGDDTQDPRDVADQLGLQDARDDSDPGPDDECPAGGDHVWTDAVGPQHEWLPPDQRWHCDECGASAPSWRDRFDTREEWEESR